MLSQNLTLERNAIAILLLLLGIFNLIPGFPLDGGHILRAALTYVVSRRNARMIAAYVGLAVAGLLALWGLSQMMIWTIFISGLLGLAAWAELRAAQNEPQFDSRSNA